MRIVRNATEFKEAFAAARGEAERAFGDGTLLVEKYIEARVTLKSRSLAIITAA